MKNCIASSRNNVCGENHNFDSDAIAGYVCSGGISDKVAHWDGITQEECNASNGLWLPVLCNDIHDLFDNANKMKKRQLATSGHHTAAILRRYKSAKEKRIVPRQEHLMHDKIFHSSHYKIFSGFSLVK